MYSIHSFAKLLIFCHLLRIGMMIGKLDYFWKRSLVTNCQLFIDRASKTIASVLSILEKDVRGEETLYTTCIHAQ